MKKLGIFIVINLLFSCSPTPEEEYVMERHSVDTIYAYYVGARNNLNNLLGLDLKEIRMGTTMIQSNGDDSIVFVSIKTPDNNAGGEPVSESGIYYFHDGVREKVLDVDLNSGDVNSLIYFINYVNEYFTYDKIVLTLWNHGSAFWLMGNNSTLENDIEPYRSERAIAYDDYYDDGLSEEEVAYAISHAASGGKVDILVYDACIMGSIESLYTLRNSADWIIASPDDMPGDGLTYDDILSNISTQSERTSFSIAKAFVDEFNRIWQDITDAYNEEWEDNEKPFHYISAIKCPEAIDETVSILDDFVTYAITNGEKEILMQVAKGLSPTRYAINEYEMRTAFENILSKMNVINYFEDNFTMDYSSFSNRYALLINDPSMMYWTYKPTLSYFGHMDYQWNSNMIEFHSSEYVRLFAEHTNLYILMHEIHFATNEFTNYIQLDYCGAKGPYWEDPTYPDE